MNEEENLGSMQSHFDFARPTQRQDFRRHIYGIVQKLKHIEDSGVGEGV